MELNDSSENNLTIIIGGGVSGLASLKCCLEKGIKAVLFEKRSGIYGIWNKELGFTWNGMITNLSQHIMQFSDFYWKYEAPRTVTRQEVEDYLKGYVKEFKMEEFIRVSVELKSAKYIESEGVWRLLMYDHNKQQLNNIDAKNLIIATGIHNKLNFPSFEGLFTEYKGNLIHSSNFKEASDYKNKKVLIIGSNHSSLTIAEAISKHTNNPIIVNFRTVPFLIPLELSIKGSIFKRTRDNVFDHYYNVEERYNRTFPRMVQISKNNYDIPEFKPVIGNKVCTAVIHDAMELIENKQIILNSKSIKSFNDKSVTFTDNSSIDIDAVICCTGYKNYLTGIFEESVLEKLCYDEDNYIYSMCLYKGLYHPESPNLFFVGAFPSISWTGIELQARLLSLLISKELEYKNKDDIFLALEKDKDLQKKAPLVNSPWPYTDYCDSIANEIGCRPDYQQLKEKDPHIYENISKIPVIASIYRLYGKDSIFEKAYDSIYGIREFY